MKRQRMGGEGSEGYGQCPVVWRTPREWRVGGGSGDRWRQETREGLSRF